MRFFLLFNLIHIISISFGQSYHLDIQGHTKVRGNLDIANMQDTSSFFIGRGAGESVDLSFERSNTIVGIDAGNLLITGLNNSFFGKDAGKGNASGSYNSFFGKGAGSMSGHWGYNSYFGYNAGGESKGWSNCFFGASAGLYNTGEANCFFGLESGMDNQAGENNNFFGWWSGKSNTTGHNNCFFGQQSGVLNTIGSSNSFFGNRSGSMNSKGIRNTYIGAQADGTSDTLNNSIALGYKARVSCDNCAVIGGLGLDAVNLGIGVPNPSTVLAMLAPGADNPVGITQKQVGLGSTMELTTADNDGDQATRLLFRGSGDFTDTEFYRGSRGNEVLSLFIKGANGHVGIGTNVPSTPFSMKANGSSFQVGITQRNVYTSGSNMELTTADGTSNAQATRISLASESDNHLTSYYTGASGSEERFALFGSDANSTYGIWVSPSASTPVYFNFRNNINTVGGSVGYDSQDGLMKLVSRNSFTTSTFGLAIDLNGDVGINTESPTEKLDVNGNIRVRSLSSNPGSALYITASGELSSGASDFRLKQNVSTLTNAMEKTMALRGVTYSWKDPAIPYPEIGLIAQEVEAVLPEVVFTNSNTGYKGVKYAEIVAVLIEAIKEQQTDMEDMQDQIDELRRLVSNLQRSEN